MVRILYLWFQEISERTKGLRDAEMKEVYNGEWFRILEYVPTILNPFYLNMEPMNIGKRARFAIDWLFGYKVYYYSLKNIGGGQDSIVAYCTVTSGENPRYFFAKKNDIIIGPYFTKPEYRGNGIAGTLVRTVAMELETNWNNAYAYIWKTKNASRRIMASMGGELVMYVHNNKMHRLVESVTGEYAVYRISR